MRYARVLWTVAVAVAFVVSACSEQSVAPVGVDRGLESAGKKSQELAPDPAVVTAVEEAAHWINGELAAQGSEYRLAMIEYITAPGSQQAGTTVFANDRGNKQLLFDFIPDDPRRGGLDGDPNTIDFWIDQTQGATSSGLTEPQTTAAIARAMTTWDSQRCSELGASVTPVAVDLGLVQLILGFGGGAAVPDVMHAGWLPGAFFDLLAPGGSTFILGVTFTLTFTVGDLNGDGLPDLAAREIYYNDAFSWAIDDHFDVETVALHEAGHGLSQGHFGKIFLTNSNGRLHFAPRAVMNAAYSGIQQDLAGTDNGGHCSIWGSWPNN